MTMKEFYENISRKFVDDETARKASNQLAKLNQRNCTKDTENLWIMEEIKKLLAETGVMTSGEIRTIISNGFYRIQKITAMLRIMKEDGIVIMIPVKEVGKPVRNYFALAEEEED